MSTVYDEIIRQICDEFMAQVEAGQYVRGNLADIAEQHFDRSAVLRLEQSVEPIVVFAATLHLGNAAGGYAEQCCSVGALGGEVVRQYDAALDAVRSGLAFMPRLAAA